MRISRLVLLFLLLALLPACTPAPEQPRLWSYQDLRALDAADAPQPGWDLLAAYVRSSGADIQIRLDFLDLADTPDFDLSLMVHRSPGQARLALAIPANGPIHAVETTGSTGQPVDIPAGSLRARVFRDPIQDVVVIHLDRRALGFPPEGFSLEAKVTPPDSSQAADHLYAPASVGPPPAAQVMLAFWDTYPAYTPALAVRRWDGAHTGPLGGRHGLANLLRVTRSANAPLFLLDLQNPTALAALELVDGLSNVTTQVSTGQLVLGQPVFEVTGTRLPVELAAGYTHDRQVSQAFGVSGAPVALFPERLLSTMPALPPGNVLVTYPGAFLEQQPFMSTLAVLHWQGLPWLRLPGAIEQAGLLDSAGFDLAARRTLIAAALQQPAAPGQVLVIGGSLPASAWGNPQAARAALAYINNHPWIRLLTLANLVTISRQPSEEGLFPSGTTLSAPARPTGAPLQPVEAGVPSAATSSSSGPLYAADNPLDLAARQVRQGLDDPIYPAAAALAALRQHYSSLTDILSLAAQWGAAPTNQARCDLALDPFASPGCVLASDTVFAVFASDRAALTHLFVRSATGLHQLVGPSSQLITGLSDGKDWDFSAGVSADPQVIPGAFWSETQDFQVQVSTTSALTFTSSSTGEARNFRLSPLGLVIFISGSSVEAGLEIPLLLDPWQRFQPGQVHRYRAETLPGALFWELPGVAALEIHTTAQLHLRAFNEAGLLLQQSEDPNLDYGPGFFLPIPLAVVELPAAGPIELQLNLVE